MTRAQLLSVTENSVSLHTKLLDETVMQQSIYCPTLPTAGMRGLYHGITRGLGTEACPRWWGLFRV